MCDHPTPNAVVEFCGSEAAKNAVAIVRTYQDHLTLEQRERHHYESKFASLSYAEARTESPLAKQLRIAADGASHLLSVGLSWALVATEGIPTVEERVDAKDADGLVVCTHMTMDDGRVKMYGDNLIFGIDNDHPLASCAIINLPDGAIVVKKKFRRRAFATAVVRSADKTSRYYLRQTDAGVELAAECERNERATLNGE